jgi:hypothetical protein
MKKAVIIGIASLVSFGAFAQGTVAFYNDAGNSLWQIYSPNPASPNTEQTGNTSSQNPVGTQTFGGTAIGGSLYNSSVSGPAPSTIGVGSPLYADGNLFTAEIYALGTSNQGTMPAFSSLAPMSQYVENFTTTLGSANAFLSQVNPANDPGVPFTGYDPNANSGNGGIDNAAWMGVAAWYNAGGQYTTLAQAQAAGAPWGESLVYRIRNLGEPASVETELNGTPTAGTPSPYLVGMQSFSLAATPEPSTIALGVMGVGAFLARRRKK